LGPFRRQLHRLLQAVTVESATCYRWLGHAVQAADAGQLRTDLARRLYFSFYCVGRPVLRPSPAPRGRLASAPFVEALSAANHGSGTWAAGWTVASTEGDSIIAHRNGLSLVALPGEYRCRSVRAAHVGAEVDVHFPKELLAISPGYYVAVGEQPWCDGDLAETLRLYVHVTAPGAVAFVDALTRGLNTHRTPFRAKVLDDPLSYNRCDAAVVYLPRAAYAEIRAVLNDALECVAAWRRAAVPALTKQLRPGVALAEDPPDADESFGSHRCRLLAAGLLEAHQRGALSASQRLEVLDQGFTNAGLSLDHPYLNSGSSDDYFL
jgi:hypothetical protein